MKRLLLLLSLTILALTSSAQRYQDALLYGENKNRLDVFYLLGIPNDTFAIPSYPSDKRRHPHLAAKGNSLYLWDTTAYKWNAYALSGGGSGGGITQLGNTGWGLIRLNDSTYLVDSMKVMTKYQSEKTRDSLITLINGKQETLVSGTNIKTINGNSLLGSGNLTIAGGSGDTSTFIVDTLYTPLAMVVGTDTVWLRSVRMRVNGTLVSPTLSDSTADWDLSTGSTYKIGTINGTTPDGNGAKIVSDSIYMQTFSSELPGLVPIGGTSSTYLRGDGTWQTVSAGSTPTLQQVTNQGSTTTNKIDISDTLQSDVIVNAGNVTLGDSAASLKYAIFYGTSITAGQGVTSAQRWSALTAAMYGMRELNRGLSGTKMVDASGSDSSMFNRIYTIPNYSSSYGALFFEYGTNDASSTDTTTFKTKYGVVLDSAIARGWPVGKITVVGPAYSIKSTIPNVAIHATAARNIAAAKGVNYVELYEYMNARGGNSLLQSDSVHISVQGNIVINNAISRSSLNYNKTAYVDVKGSVNVRDSMYVGGSVGIGVTNTDRATLEMEGSIVENYSGGTTGIYQTYLTGTDFNFGVEFQGATRIVNFLNKANGQASTTSAFTWQTGTTTSPTVMLTMARNGNLTSTGSLIQTQGDFISNYTGTTKFIGSKYLTGSSYQWGIEIGEGAGGSTGTFKLINRNTSSTSTAAAFQFQTSTTGTVADIVTMLRNGNTGFGQTSPTSIVHLGGSFATAYVAKSASYTATISDCVIEVTTDAQTITLPTAVGITGRQYTVKLTASGTGTVATTSSQTIDGATTYSLSAQYKYVTVQSNGANWIIIANN